jgi:hypothetical protein
MGPTGEVAREDVGVMREVMREVRGDEDGMTVPREGERRGEQGGTGPREIPVKVAIGEIITGGGENDQRPLLVKLRSSRICLGSLDPSSDILLIDAT